MASEPAMLGSMPRTCRSAHEQTLHHLFVLAEGAGVADPHREAIPALDGLGDDPAAQGDLDGVLDVADADAVACRLLAGRS